MALCRRLKLNLNPFKAYLRQLMNNFNEKKVNQDLQMIFNVGINIQKILKRQFYLIKIMPTVVRPTVS